MTTTPLRNPATLEEYTAYKALKEDRIPIIGYESPARQFNLVARIGSIYEAINLVLGASDVDTLAQALKNFELEPEVKTALEERVLAGIIQLGERKQDRSWNQDKYGPTLQLLTAARKYSTDLPDIIEDVAHFLLHDENSLQPEYETGEQLCSENVQGGIELLSGIGKSPAEVADELAEAVKGKHGSFHTITRYREGVLSYKTLTRFENVNSAFSSILPELLTPELLEDALRQIKLSEEEFRAEKPATRGTYYDNVKRMAEKVRNGSYEQFSDLKDGHPTAERESYLKSVESRIESIGYDFGNRYKNVNSLVKSFQEDHIAPLVTVLQNLESNLGRDEFIARGYTKVQEQIDRTVQEVNEWQTYLKTELPLVKERLEGIYVQGIEAKQEAERLKNEPEQRARAFVAGCVLAQVIGYMGLNYMRVKDFSTGFSIEVIAGLATGMIAAGPVYNYIRDRIAGKKE